MAANRFNRCVGREVKDGASFKTAVSRCKGNRSRSGRRRRRG
jgi:hypothetical protein